MRTKVLVVACAVLLAGNLPGARGQTTAAPQPEMTTYQVVLLLRGPNRLPIEERDTQALQEGHLHYLKRLLDEDRAIVAGPVDGGEDLRGIVVLDVGSVEEARTVMAADPWVRAQRLVPEIHPWLTVKGVFRETDEFLHHETCYLGLLRRPENAPVYSEARLEEIQAGHMANIQRMAQEGALVTAGPMTDDGLLRGVLVFRSGDPERIREMVARDPAIEAGRLWMELYPWNVPKGSLPVP